MDRELRHGPFAVLVISPALPTPLYACGYSTKGRISVTSLSLSLTTM
jgi:hypothetical protein